jgi:hypothetical protein
VTEATEREGERGKDDQRSEEGRQH